MMKPNLMVIGAQKGGTTWIHRNLARHPQIFMSKVKEMDFFTYSRKIEKENGFKEYLDEFSSVKGVNIIGESTPGYFWTSDNSKWCLQSKNWNKDIPGSIKKMVGKDLKFILSLRNPIDRAISAFYHHFKQGRISGKDAFFDVAHKFGIIDMGFYKKHYQNWVDVFPKENIKVVNYRDIKTNTQELLNELCDFLGVSRMSLPQRLISKKKENPGFKLKYFSDGYISIDANSSKKLNKLYYSKKLPGVQDITVFPKVTNDDFLRIYDLFQDDIEFVINQFKFDGDNFRVNRLSDLFVS